MSQAANLALLAVATLLIGGLIFSGCWAAAAVAVWAWVGVEFRVTEWKRDRA